MVDLHLDQRMTVTLFMLSCSADADLKHLINVLSQCNFINHTNTCSLHKAAETPEATRTEAPLEELVKLVIVNRLHDKLE